MSWTVRYGYSRYSLTRVCSLGPEALKNAASIIEHYQQFWNERLDSLERHLVSASEPGSARRIVTSASAQNQAHAKAKRRRKKNDPLKS